jgi:hypothetical protein
MSICAAFDVFVVVQPSRRSWAACSDGTVGSGHLPGNSWRFLCRAADPACASPRRRDAQDAVCDVEAPIPQRDRELGRSIRDVPAYTHARHKSRPRLHRTGRLCSAAARPQQRRKAGRALAGPWWDPGLSPRLTLAGPLRTSPARQDSQSRRSEGGGARRGCCGWCSRWRVVSSRSVQGHHHTGLRDPGDAVALYLQDAAHCGLREGRESNPFRSGRLIGGASLTTSLELGGSALWGKAKVGGWVEVRHALQSAPVLRAAGNACSGGRAGRKDFPSTQSLIAGNAAGVSVLSQTQDVKHRRRYHSNISPTVRFFVRLWVRPGSRSTASARGRPLRVSMI